MEERFGQSFADVRVHADADAARLSRGLGARAFTIGQDIAFGGGQFQPGTARGDRLIAHELAHTLQQRGGSGGVMTKGQRHDAHEQAADQAAVLAVGAGLPVRDLGARLLSGGGAPPSLQLAPDDVDTRIDDPNFLLCTLLCYIGLPTPLWKHLIDLFLQAVWEEYRANAQSEEAAKRQYAAYHIGFKGYSFFNIIKLVLVFMMEGKIGLVPVKAAAAKALQRTLLAQAVKLGAKVATLEIASQAVRKIALFIEGMIIATCAGYCGAEAYAKAMVEFGTALAEGLSTTAQILAGVGNLVQTITGNLIARPILYARATVDPTNWDTSLMPTPTNADFRAVGNYLWSKLDTQNLENFLANVNKPMKSYQVPASLVTVLASGLQKAVNARKGYETMVFTADLIGGMPLLHFVQFLNEWGLLKFKKDPSAIADAEMGTPTP